MAAEPLADGVVLELRQGRVTARIDQADLKRVLAVLAEKAGVEIESDAHLTGTVSIQVDGVTIEDFLRRICENRALVFERDPDNGAWRLIRAGAFASGKAEEGRAAAVSGGGSGSVRVMTAAAGGADRDAQGRLRHKPFELLVRFRPDAAEADIDALHRRTGSRVIGTIARRRLHRVRFPSTEATVAALDAYREAPIVAHVERHALRYPMMTTNDPLTSEQWALDRMSLPGAWAFSTGSDAVVIAVIDSGVDYTHPDLAGNIWVNADEQDGRAGIDDDGNGYVDDVVGWDFGGDVDILEDPDADPIDGAASSHGTHVAGIAAATGNNGEGIAGVAWTARIMALKVKADDTEYFDSFHIIEAMDYARSKGARVVNCSFGGDADSAEEYAAIAALGQAGALVLCAAGNEADDLDQDGPLYPASYDLDNIVSVAAGTQTDALATFSNWGHLSVDVLAPGVSIKSTVPEAFYSAVSVNGTSYAAIGMLFAGTTCESGVSGDLVDCGEGYPSQFPVGRQDYLALIWRSPPESNFLFSQKVANAQAAGAAGVVVANNRVDDLDVNGGTLGAPNGWVPAVTVTQAVGEALASAAGSPATLIHRLVDTAGAYADKDGTSMATPQVAGVAALVWSARPSMEVSQVKAVLLDTVDPLPNLADRLVSGGRVNAQSALCAACALTGDLNCDGRIDLADAVSAAQTLGAMRPPICRVCMAYGTDPVPNGRIGLNDLIHLLHQAAGLRQ